MNCSFSKPYSFSSFVPENQDFQYIINNPYDYSENYEDNLINNNMIEEEPFDISFTPITSYKEFRPSFLQSNQKQQQHNEDNIYDVIEEIQQGIPMLVYIYKPGCPYCINFDPKFNVIKQYVEEKYPDVLVRKVNGSDSNNKQLLNNTIPDLNLGPQPGQRKFPSIYFQNFNEAAVWEPSINDTEKTGIIYSDIYFFDDDTQPIDSINYSYVSPNTTINNYLQ